MWGRRKLYDICGEKKILYMWVRRKLFMTYVGETKIVYDICEEEEIV
jgi:hypothetical protein